MAQARGEAAKREDNLRRGPVEVSDFGKATTRNSASTSAGSLRRTRSPAPAAWTSPHPPSRSAPRPRPGRGHRRPLRPASPKCSTPGCPGRAGARPARRRAHAGGNAARRHARPAGARRRPRYHRERRHPARKALALEVEAKIRVTDEYEAAQAAGEAATNRGEGNPGRSAREGDQALGTSTATLDEVGPRLPQGAWRGSAD